MTSRKTWMGTALAAAVALSAFAFGAGDVAGDDEREFQYFYVPIVNTEFCYGECNGSVCCKLIITE